MVELMHHQYHNILRLIKHLHSTIYIKSRMNHDYFIILLFKKNLHKYLAHKRHQNPTNKNKFTFKFK